MLSQNNDTLKLKTELHPLGNYKSIQNFKKLLLWLFTECLQKCKTSHLSQCVPQIKFFCGLCLGWWLVGGIEIVSKMDFLSSFHFVLLHRGFSKHYIWIKRGSGIRILSLSVVCPIYILPLTCHCTTIFTTALTKLCSLGLFTCALYYFLSYSV